MAGRLLISCMKKANCVKIRSYSDLQGPPINAKYGNREIVGYGMNGEAAYLDLEDYPMPAIRFKEITPTIQVLKDKEKGDWKKMTIAEKKELYRASFCQTFAELNAPTGEWKKITGGVLIGLSVSLWIYIFMRNFVLPDLPESMLEHNKLAQLERMRILDVNPIHGINRRT